MNPTDSRAIDLLNLAETLSGPFGTTKIEALPLNRIRLRVIENHAAQFHKHDDGVEVFYVMRGRFWLDFEGRSIEVTEGSMITAPAGIPHRARAEEKVVLLVLDGYDPIASL